MIVLLLFIMRQIDEQNNCSTTLFKSICHCLTFSEKTACTDFLTNQTVKNHTPFEIMSKEGITLYNIAVSRYKEENPFCEPSSRFLHMLQEMIAGMLINDGYEKTRNFVYTARIR